MQHDVLSAITPRSCSFHVQLDPIGRIAILDATRCTGGFHINRINVPEGHRGCGIGSALMQALKSHAQQAGIDNIFVEPGGYDSADQERRIRFYRRHGFNKHPAGYYVLRVSQDPNS